MQDTVGGANAATMWTEWYDLNWRRAARFAAGKEGKKSQITLSRLSSMLIDLTSVNMVIQKKKIKTKKLMTKKIDETVFNFYYKILPVKYTRIQKYKKIFQFCEYRSDTIILL